MSLAKCLAVLFLIPVHVQAQETKRERVRFSSRDGVELYADFYPGRGKAMPTVLLLPDRGENRRAGNWRTLGEFLEKKGCTVLTLDWRGHGDSTDVDPMEFWQPLYPNAGLIQGEKKDLILQERFEKRYDAILLNDLAAARAFLDRKNDQGEANTSNLVLIAAGKSATLAAVWIHSEWCRYAVLPPSFVGQPPQINNLSEGTGLLGAVFLSMETTLGGGSVNLVNQLQLAARHGKMPMAFLHGEDDEAGERLAKSLEKSLRRNLDLPYLGATALPKTGARKGSALLDKHLGASQAIWEYLETIKDARGREWLDKDTRTAAYVWRLPGQFLRPLPANHQGDSTLFFDTYERFIYRRSHPWGCQKPSRSVSLRALQNSSGG